MSFLKWLIVSGVVAGSVVPMSATALAEEYRDDAHHFSLVLPEEWSVVSPEMLSVMNKLGRERLPTENIRFEAAFQPKERWPGSWPYILVQFQPHPSAYVSYEEIERGFAKDLINKGVKQAERA